MKSIQVSPIILGAIVILIVALFAISYFGIKDANSCLSNPLVYGAEKATSLDTGDLFCSCSFTNPRYTPLYFTADGMSTDREELFS